MACGSDFELKVYKSFCLAGLSTSQPVVFFSTPNQPPAINQQYFFLKQISTTYQPLPADRAIEGKEMMWPGSNPDNEIDPQFNTIDEPCVSIDISNLCLSNAPDDFILFSRLQCFISITDEV